MHWEEAEQLGNWVRNQHLPGNQAHPAREGEGAGCALWGAAQSPTPGLGASLPSTSPQTPTSAPSRHAHVRPYPPVLSFATFQLTPKFRGLRQYGSCSRVGV